MNERLHNMGSWQKDSRDEDLALFHDMRRRERRNFLCPLKDDIDASPRRDDGFSTFCVSASTPARNGHNLLPLDSEKNDYDWLLTPPSTPLFPSLDQDVPIVNLSQRRVLTRSASVSKTARLSYPQEPSPRILHGGNPSPRRPSTASSTSSTTSTNRGRPSLTSRSSPTLRSSSPCRPTTPTGRHTVAASRSASRSLTPTLRRNNTSPSPANRTGPTCGRSRGKSVSPKLGPWEPSLPGFSTEPPPNLRTSLSDRTIQRGVSQATRNGVKSRGSFVETSEGSSQSQWHGISPDESGNRSLSYANEHNSSQTSRASMVSSLDDDVEMAESVVSGSTRMSCDSGPKSANAISTTFEDPSMKRSILPAKRQMRPTGTTGDTMPFLSLSARKSYERQAAQRRSTQTMFRPLLSSAPITSFYTTRPSGMHLRSSSTSMESCATHNGSSQLSRDEDLHGETATEVAVNCRNSEYGAADCSDSSGQETTEESGDNSPSSKEEALKCQSGSELRDTPNDKGETAGGSNKGLQIINSSVCLPQPQPLEREITAQQEDTACDMETEVNTCAEGCTEGNHMHKEHKFSLSCADECGMPSTVSGQSKESVHSLEGSKAKELHVEDQKLVASVKVQTYLGVTGNGCSQHGTQRVVSDSGSFRKQSPMKNLNTRSHDGSMATERTVSCDSFTSDSHSFIRSLPSAFSNGESTGTPFECSGDAIEASVCCDSLNKVLYSERSPSSLEKGVSSHAIPTDTIGDTSQCYRSCETSTTMAHVSQCTAMNQSGLFEDHSQGHGLNVDASEAATSELGELLVSDATDKLTQQDILSIIGGCPPKIAALGEDVVVQYECTVAASSIQSRRFSDVLHTTPRLAAEGSEEDDLSQKQVPGVPLLKRSVTLEEATDTILFCSSIIHELVYKSATLAIENEEQKTSKPSVSRRDFVTLFGFSGAEHRANGVKESRLRNRKRQPLGNAAVCETSSFVQKQRMVHRQTPALTMRQSPMDRIENAVIGNHEEIQVPNVSRLQKRKTKKGKKIQCRCSCCMM